MDFTGKTVIVTGSARGIGRAIAQQFARFNANVVISDLERSAVNQAVAEVSSDGGTVVGHTADVMSPDDIEGLFTKVVDQFGRVDIVVNNAGITRDSLVVRMEEKDWDLVLDINLKGAFLVTKAAAKVMMKQRSGRIVNISSVVGINGNAGQVNYASSKAGLIGLTKSVAKELAGRGITVNAVAPGFIATQMTAAIPEAARQQFLQRVYLKRAGTPQDVANAVLFFASEEASYVTGQVLAVDGGLSMS